MARAVAPVAAAPAMSRPDEPRWPVQAALSANGPAGLFTIAVLRHIKTYGLTREQLGMVSLVQRE